MGWPAPKPIKQPMSRHRLLQHSLGPGGPYRPMGPMDPWGPGGWTAASVAGELWHSMPALSNQIITRSERMMNLACIFIQTKKYTSHVLFHVNQKCKPNVHFHLSGNIW